jgi:uncharacterized membrane protein YbjE (DUF340 family)
VFLLVGSLVFGFVAARWELVPKKWNKRVNGLGNLALVFLLFSMGISLGSHPDLKTALPSLGLKALILSVGTIMGSVFLVWLAARIRRPEN